MQQTLIYDTHLNFCKFKIPQKGARVIWEITNECNYGCSYCIFSSTGKKPVGELTQEQIFNVIAQLKESSFNSIKLTGGEPFLRPDIMPILKEIDNLGFNWDISTNASRITPKIAQQLSALSPDFIHVSLDGHTQEIHESVRGKRSFIPTLNGLKLLLEYGLKIRVGCVLHVHNEQSIEQMIQWCEQLGVSELVFSVMESVGRLRGKEKGVITRPLQELIEDIEKATKKTSIKVNHNLTSLLKEKIILSPQINKKDSIKIEDHEDITKPSCPGGTRFIFINSIGQVSPCTWVSERANEYIESSLHEKSLSQILQGDKFSAFIKKVDNLKASICPMEDAKIFNEIGK